MKNKITSFLVSIVLLFVTPFNGNAQGCETFPEDDYGGYVTPSRIMEMAANITCFYGERFGYTRELTRGIVLEQTINLLETEFNEYPYNPSIQPDSMLFRYGYNPISLKYELEIDWKSSHSNCETYIGKYHDYELNSTTTHNHDSPSFVFDELESVSRKLYLVKSVCEGLQTGFFFIIIEEDLDLSPWDVLLMPEEIDPILVPKLATNNPSTKWSVFPNPIAGNTTQIALELSKDQMTSLSILEGSTGKLMKTIWSERLLEKGMHRKDLSLDNLTAGMYYLVLQTEEGRKVQKLLVL